MVINGLRFILLPFRIFMSWGKFNVAYLLYYAMSSGLVKCIITYVCAFPSYTTICYKIWWTHVVSIPAVLLLLHQMQELYNRLIVLGIATREYEWLLIDFMRRYRRWQPFRSSRVLVLWLDVVCGGNHCNYKVINDHLLIEVGVAKVRELSLWVLLQAFKLNIQWGYLRKLRQTVLVHIHMGWVN